MSTNILVGLGFILAGVLMIANRLTKGFFDDSMSVFEKYQLF